MKYSFNSVVCILLAVTSFYHLHAQDMQKIKQQQDSTYQENIKKTRLYGVYIPKDLNDAFTQLDKLSSEEARQKFKEADEELVAKKLHFGLGRWMAYNWNFEEGSRFSHYLRKLGLSNADDMVDFMLISYNRYLNDKEQEVESRVKVYQEMEKKRKEESMKNSEILNTEVKPIPKKEH